MNSRLLVLLGVAMLVAGPCWAESKAPAPGEIVGRVELAPNVPCTSCTILVEGSPLGARTDANGVFSIRNMPPGRWDLRITASDLPDPRFRAPAGSNPGTVTDLGILRPWPPGNIAGRVELPGGYMLADTVVELPVQGIAVKPNPDGTFLLQGVAVGKREIVVNTAQRRLHKKAFVTVQPGQTARISVKIDDPAATVVKPSTTVPTDRANKVTPTQPVKPVR